MTKLFFSLLPTQCHKKVLVHSQLKVTNPSPAETRIVINGVHSEIAHEHKFPPSWASSTTWKMKTKRKTKYRSLCSTIKYTVKPCCSAPTFNMIPPIEHTNFGSKKHFHSYLNVGNNKNLYVKDNFDQSLEMRYGGVYLYLYVGNNKNLYTKDNINQSLEMRYSGV